MRIVLQRVLKATVTVKGKLIGSIDNGLVLLLGITHTDSEKEAKWLADKVQHLRLFAQEGTKSGFDESVIGVGGGILVISQFTLFANVKKGRRPSFVGAAESVKAKQLYEYFVKYLKESYAENRIQTGIFGEYMNVELVNNGPVTLIVDTDLIR